MAEHSDRIHDGRFGERFDDEISLKGLGQITVGIAITCILGMAITWVMIWPEAGSVGMADAEALEQALPPGPRLQPDPEGEYQAMRRELDAHIEGYGWVDEAAGIVHVPIDDAIDMTLERGLGAWEAAAPLADGEAQDSAPAQDSSSGGEGEAE